MSENSSFKNQYRALEHSKNFGTITEHSLENEGVDSKRDPVKFEQGLELYAEWLGKTYGNNTK